MSTLIQPIPRYRMIQPLALISISPITIPTNPLTMWTHRPSHRQAITLTRRQPTSIRHRLPHRAKTSLRQILIRTPIMIRWKNRQQSFIRITFRIILLVYSIASSAAKLPLTEVCSFTSVSGELLSLFISLIFKGRSDLYIAVSAW